MNPMLEVIFEEPAVDQTNADFFLPLIVRDKSSNELFLYVQIGNKGIHKNANVYLDIFRLKEKMLINFIMRVTPFSLVLNQVSSLPS